MYLSQRLSIIIFLITIFIYTSQVIYNFNPLWDIPFSFETSYKDVNTRIIKLLEKIN